ncbi:Eisosome assembly protein [Diatrype stigma]|uniref:Eisosome assembly protein n=1 Tax=Diatrype stigma TaxID=117547 RepID=A0AAN9VBZ7_9PEZI
MTAPKTNESAASTAATLGWTSSKTPELWKPQLSASSSASAVLAKDYKMAAPWEPVSSSDGAKAALLAARNTKNPETWKPQATNYGFSAANLAFKSDRSTSQSSKSSTLESQRSLHAARGAMTGRQRAKSTPLVRESYPDEVNAASNALAAATRAHKPAPPASVSDETGSVPFTMMNRQMFTSRPPVKPEVDEQKKSDILHASAVAMAKKMYTQQQKIIDAKKSQVEVASSRGRRGSLSNVSDDGQPMQITTLQDAAYRQAQERLAKLHQENLKNREYQEYYGAGNLQRRFTIRNKLRRRASSDSAVVDDQARSQQIRQQMSIFSTKLSEVDDKKRQQDRDALLAVAHRNVQARLRSMDEKITAETGMVPPSILTQWELKAHAAAQHRSEARVDHDAGKVDVGAGLHLDQEAIDAIAARRVQPLLDEINEKAEEEHARQLQLKLEMERKKEEEEVEKARQKEIQDITKRLKGK